MTTRLPTAFALSAFLHGTVAALVLAFAWVTQKNARPTPLVFELVAGTGNNFGATVAPAAGNSTSAQTDLVKEMQRVAKLQEQRVIAAANKQQAALEKEQQRLADLEALAQTKPKPTVVPTKPVTAPLTKVPTPKPGVVKPTTPGTTPRPVTVPRIDTMGIVGGVVGGSIANRVGGAGGTALTRTTGTLSEAYIALLRQHLREAHQRPDGLSDLLQATVEFRLNSDGSVTGAHIVSSSGNAAFDKSVLAAFRTMQPLTAPPAGTADTYTVTFKMRDDA